MRSILLALVALTGLRAPVSGPCDQLQNATALPIDSMRVGPFPRTAPLDSLRRLCPAARPTLGHGFETVWAALDVGIGELRIIAGQNWLFKPAFDGPPGPDPTVDWSRPPSHWVVSGCGGMLPRGVSTCATWAELTAAFGARGRGSAEFGPVIVRLDALPGLSFQLDATDETVGSIETQEDLARIPATARIVEIVIASP